MQIDVFPAVASVHLRRIKKELVWFTARKSVDMGAGFLLRRAS